MPDDQKRFRLVKPGTDEDVLGGALGRDNPYVGSYGATLPGEKSVDDLEVGEGCNRRYALSGQKPTVYRVIRIDDECACGHDVARHKRGAGGADVCTHFGCGCNANRG